MADEDKLKVHSLPPPPTDEIDEDWGSSGTASSAPGKAEGKGPESKKSAGKSAVPQKKASPRDDDDENEEEEEDDDDDDDEEGDDDEDGEGDDDDDDDDEDDDDEDEDDEEEEKESRRSARKRAASPSTGGAFDDLIPDWAPWATLGGLLLFGFLGGVGILPISCNLTPAVASAEPPATPAPAATPAATARATASARTPRPQRPEDGEMVAASHLLVSYKGSLRAQATVTRTKEEAEKRAKEALAKAKKGQEFEKLVAEYSDEPMAAQRGGKLGKFSRGNMVKEFSDAAFALKVGQLSGLVETKFGYHVIKRTE